MQGLPASVLGVIAFFYLDDGPQQAKWLTDSEKAVVLDDIRKSSSVSAKHAEHTFGRTLANFRVYVMGFVWFTQIAGVFAIGFLAADAHQERGRVESAADRPRIRRFPIS